MANSHSRWKDNENTRYPSVDEPGPARGGGSGDRAPLEREVEQATREFNELDKKAAGKEVGDQGYR